MNIERRGFVIRWMKGLPDGSGVRFPIRNPSLGVIGYLRAFDRRLLADDGLIETMARARTLYKDNFMTRFDVTPENKRNWLEKSVLGNDRKMLFLVETSDGRVVGQDGFTMGDDGKIFYLDASMRWARGGGDIFHRGGVERAAMGFFLLGCERCVVEIFGKNALVIDNSLRAGFRVEREYRLRVSEREGSAAFAKEDDPSMVNTDEILVSLFIDRERFAARNETIAENPCWEHAERIFG